MLIATLVMLLLTIIPSSDAEASEPATPVVNESSHSLYSQSGVTGQLCGEAWFEAASISKDDVQNPETDLDNAVRACRTLSSWYSEAVKYPQLLGGRSSIEVLVDRCKKGPVEAYICEWIHTNPDIVESEL